MFGREEFLSERLDLQPDEGVTIVGPTGSGKTWLAWQMLGRTATPKNPAVVMLRKPVDYATSKYARELGFRVERDWPPAWKPFQTAPSGWLVHPRTRFDPDIDRPHKAAVFRRAMLDSYRRGRRRVYIDDAYGISEILKLREVVVELLTEIRAMDGSMMLAFQKPSHVPQWAFNNAEHLLLFHDPDRRNRIRFAEIGGIDSDLVQETVMGLKRHQALYIRRDGPAACIVDR